MHQNRIENLSIVPELTGFPGLAITGENRKIITRALNDRKAGLGLLYLQIPNLHRLYLVDGDYSGLELCDSVAEQARESFAEAFNDHECIFWQAASFDERVLIFRCPREGLLDRAKYYALFNTILSKRLEQVNPTPVAETMQVSVGFSLFSTDPPVEPDRRLLKAYCEAKQFSRSIIKKHQLPLHNEFSNILEAQALSPVFQPIISFADGKTIGWEAFTRGPKGDPFETPAVFLKFAEQADSISELDRICRTKALEKAGFLHSEQKLFLNTHPVSLRNASFSSDIFADTLHELRLNPANIVLEFSSSCNLADSAILKQMIQPYRDLGCQISIDDLGSGGDSLGLLCAVQPSYLKLNRNQVRGVESDPAKRLMVETLLKFAESIKATLIALGIETQAEFNALVSMGVHAGQGLFFAGFDNPKKTVEVSLPKSATFALAKDEGWVCANPVGNIAETGLVASPDETVRQLKSRFVESTPTYSVAIIEDSKPIGQIMSYNLDRCLAHRFGISLYYEKSVTKIMNPAPLLTEASQSVEDVARLAMARPSQEIYDDIIVTENASYAGTVSVQKLLDYLALAQLELAKGANPLTGLPGNLAIEREIDRRIKDKSASSLVYIDLDNFKVFNDTYGFKKGDSIILLTASALRSAAQQYFGPDSFIGHVGGDDFLAICSHDSAEPFGKAVIDYFKERVPEYYPEADRKAGKIHAVGRDGIRRDYSLVSLSVGIIDFQFDQPFSLEELSDRAAKVKKYAKSQEGNSCVRDRRSPLGSEEI